MVVIIPTLITCPDMTRYPLADLLDSVLAIAIAAGKEILDVYQSDFAVSTKDDASPLTQADLRAHRVIIDGLKALTPDIPCLSEEDADIDFDVRSGWTRYWLIDPLDGTKEFIKRNGDFTVNIALIDHHESVLGVVHVPVTDTSYLAARDVGAFVIRDGQRSAIRTRATPVKPSLVVTKSHRDAALDEFLAHAPAHEQVSRGSSLKFCMVAEGLADFYPRTGPTSEWDTAAAQCLAEVAGATVLRLPDWQPLRYNTKESLLNPGFVVIGDPAYGWRERLKAG
jgi:3'(2'), 5'-bisphosphate nucleotidase